MEDVSLNMSTNEFSTMAGISAKGKGSQLGWLGWVCTCWQCGRTILKNCKRQGLSCAARTSLISQLHKCSLLLIYFLIVLFIGKWGRGKIKKIDLSFNWLSNNFCSLSKVMIMSETNYPSGKSPLLYWYSIKDEVSPSLVFFKLDVAEVICSCTED